MLHDKIHRYLVLIVSLVVLLSFLAPVYALKGGPDRDGYRYIDSQERGGPKFDEVWRELDIIDAKLHEANPGLPITEHNEALQSKYIVKVPIGFPFYFYGQRYEYFYLSGDGYLTFSYDGVDHTSHAYDGQPVPSANGLNNFIAPFWSDNRQGHEGRT